MLRANNISANRREFSLRLIVRYTQRYFGSDIKLLYIFPVRGIHDHIVAGKSTTYSPLLIP